jgi:hypothetical protein
LFEDLIPDKKYIKPGVYENKDSLVEALKDNVKLKEDHIKDLLQEIVNRGQTIKDMQKEIDYLTDL